MTLPNRLRLVILFLILSVLVMFMDGLIFDNFNAKPSMALAHGHSEPVIGGGAKGEGHGAHDHEDEGAGHEGEGAGHEEDMPSLLRGRVVEENGTNITEYVITLNNIRHEIRPGVVVPMFGFNGQVPGPILRAKEGERIRVIFRNNGTDPHTIHWHGVNSITAENDGVPGLGQAPVMPGEEYTYEFTASPSGTKMYHCHVEAPHHIQMGMFGALIVEPQQESALPFGPADRDDVFILSEFASRHTHRESPADEVAGPDGPIPWLTAGPKAPRAFDPQLDEFLINGKAFPAVPPYTVREGQVVRWRIINLGLKTHSMHIHGHHFTVTHRDGFHLPEPFEADTLLIGPGERYDVWFKADNQGVWLVHDHAGLNTQARGYEPAGMMFILQYEGYTTKAYEDFLRRIRTYNRVVPETRGSQDGHGGGHEGSGGNEHGGHSH